MASPAEAGCITVDGTGVCQTGTVPVGGPVTVTSPTEICYLVDCIPAGQEFTVPLPGPVNVPVFSPVVGPTAGDLLETIGGIIGTTWATAGEVLEDLGDRLNELPEDLNDFLCLRTPAC